MRLAKFIKRASKSRTNALLARHAEQNSIGIEDPSPEMAVGFSFDSNRLRQRPFAATCLPQSANYLNFCLTHPQNLYHMNSYSF